FAKEYVKDKEIRAAHGSVVWHRDAAYYASGAWRGKWETEGGGSLINQALHTLDLTMWFSGDPESALATAANLTLKNEIEVEDTIFARFAGEVPFTFLGTNVSVADMPVEITLRLADHTVVTVLPSTVLINGIPVPSATVKKEAHGKECYGSGHGALIDDFHTCVAEGRHFPIDGREGARVIRLILAAYESARENKEVKIK
ncbi:MAG: gfo/Idh/MocA family oxidoreductase, partial [Ruminococcaceae bacterium]|nr:gfo/Idh/MocA family oxidoreductase [Oscillospiraceae bacterium]